MNDPSVDGLVAQGPGRVSDLVRWVDKIAALKSTLCLEYSLLRTAGRGRLEVGRKTRQRTRAAWPDGRWCRWKIVLDGIFFWISTGVWTEVRGFIHVDPQAINVDTGLRIEEGAEFRVPVVLSVRVKPIWIRSHTRPHGT